MSEITITFDSNTPGPQRIIRWWLIERDNAEGIEFWRDLWRDAMHPNDANKRADLLREYVENNFEWCSHSLESDLIDWCLTIVDWHEMTKTFYDDLLANMDINPNKLTFEFRFSKPGKIEAIYAHYQYDEWELPNSPIMAALVHECTQSGKTEIRTYLD